MDQDQRLNVVADKIDRYVPLTATELDPGLSEADSFLKYLRIKCFGWSGDRIDKLGALRFTVAYPALDALTVLLYPKKNLDAPIFLFFCLLTKRKTIFHVNVNTPFDDDAYKAKWVDPLMPIMDRFPSFETKDRYPEWMKKYHHPPTIYGLYPKDREDELTECMFGYLDIYLPLLATAEPVTDPKRLAMIEAFHEELKSDIRTRDKAQSMTAKFIGKDRAHRLFYEVAT